MKHDTPRFEVQGEGDCASARKYNQAARSFAGSGQIEQTVRNAARRNAQEKAEIRKAEAGGRSHANGVGKGEAKDKGKSETGSELSPGRKPDE